jgi:hypothetical protein
MAKAISVWIDEFESRKEIRIDWDNDRHQAVKISGSSPDALIYAFEEMAQLLRREQMAEFI